MILKLSKRLHRDQKGFLSPIILFMVIALAYMIVWILNTGQSLYDKQRTQDTADAAAMVHSDWSARYLNIMAMNNVASSQATVMLVASTAYQAALAELQFRSLWVAGQLAEYTLEDGFGPPNFRIPVPVPYCPTWGKTPLIGGLLQAACSAYQGIRAAGAVRATAYFWSSMSKYEPQNLMSKAEDIISAMNDMNKYLVDSFPERVGNEGLNLVRLNRVDHLVYHPACSAGETCDAGKEGQGGNLPVETSVGYTQLAYQEMCMAMSDGTKDFGVPIRGEFANRGFPDGKGPLTAGGKGNTHIRDHVNHEGGMASELPAFYWFYEVFGPAYYTGLPFRQLIESQTGSVDLDPIFDELGLLGDVLGGIADALGDAVDAAVDFAIDEVADAMGINLGVTNPFQLGIDVPPRYSEVQKEDDNDFTQKFDTLWAQACLGGEGGGTGIAGVLLSVAGLLPEPYWLKGRNPAGMFDPVTNRVTSNQIDDYRALAVVSRQPRSRLQPKLFRERSPAAYAMAESWVHNYTSFDLYTQDWMASLAPTSLADDIQAVSSTIKNSPASDSYSSLTQVFDQGGANGWSDVNNH